MTDLPRHETIADAPMPYLLLLKAHDDGRESIEVASAFAAAAVLAAPALRDIAAERIAQIEKHGFTLEHDLGHHPGNLALASASYLNAAIDQLHRRGEPVVMPDPATWPWDDSWWKPGDARANLIKAIAIAWATVDRIDAAAADSPKAAAA